MQVSARPRSRKIIRKITENVREQLGMKNMYHFPIVQVIELLAADENEDFDFEIIDNKRMSDIYGKTNTVNNKMEIREDVYDGAVSGNPRDRFTLCHELGHWLLHQPEDVSFARGKIPKYCDPEWQANTFAAELLVPNYLTKNMNVKEITVICGVSFRCAEIQKSCS